MLFRAWFGRLKCLIEDLIFQPKWDKYAQALEINFVIDKVSFQGISWQNLSANGELNIYSAPVYTEFTSAQTTREGQKSFFEIQLLCN